MSKLTLLDVWLLTCPKGHEAPLETVMKSKVIQQDGVDYDSWYALCPECGEKYWL